MLPSAPLVLNVLLVLRTQATPSKKAKKSAKKSVDAAAAGAGDGVGQTAGTAAVGGAGQLDRGVLVLEVLQWKPVQGELL